MHERYEKLAIKELMKTFRRWAKNIPFDTISESNYSQLIQGAINPEEMMATYVDIYTKIGLAHGKKISANIDSQLKATNDAFKLKYLADINSYLTQHGMKKIVTVSSTYFGDMNNLFKDRLVKGMDIRQAAREVKKMVNRKDFYQWQALRIARTETTAAANYSASISSSVSGYVMQKEWISSLDKRTRDPHRFANGTRVLEYEKFEVNGELLKYPGDPTASGGNVINCRCTVAVIAARDKNGDLIPLGSGTLPPTTIPKPPKKPTPQPRITGKPTEAETRSINTYTGGDYREINDRLRGLLSRYALEDIKEITRLDNLAVNINSGLTKLPSFKKTTWRGEKFYGSQKKEFEEYLAKIKPGGKLKQDAFLSTSADKGVASSFGSINSDTERFAGRILFEIRAKRGKSIKEWSRFKNEKEVLYKSGTEFDVVSVEKVTGKYNQYNVILE